MDKNMLKIHLGVPPEYLLAGAKHQRGGRAFFRYTITAITSGSAVGGEISSSADNTGDNGVGSIGKKPITLDGEGEYEVWVVAEKKVDGKTATSNIATQKFTQKYDLTVNVTPENVVSIGVVISGIENTSSSSAKYRVVHGTEVELTAKSKPDYRFTSWSADAGSGSNTTTNVTMDEDKNITATFIATNLPIITDTDMIIEDNGTVTISVDGNKIDTYAAYESLYKEGKPLYNEDLNDSLWSSSEKVVNSTVTSFIWVERFYPPPPRA